MSYQILIGTLYLKTKMRKKCGIFSKPNFIRVWKITYQKEGMITGLHPPPPPCGWTKMQNWRLSISEGYGGNTNTQGQGQHTLTAINRNSCTNIIRNSKLSYELKIVLESKTNNKSFWK